MKTVLRRAPRGGSHRTGSNLTLSWDLSEIGDYFVRVRDLASRMGGEYTLTATLTPTPDPFEPNHDFTRAAQIMPDDLVQAYIAPAGEEDWYQVTTATPGSLSLSLTDVPVNLRMEIAALGRDREWLSVSSAAVNLGDDVFLTLDIAAAGTYSIRIRDLTGAANPSEPYTLTTRFAAADDLYEPNPDVLSAPLLTASPIQACSFPAGDYDYYRFYAGTGSAPEFVVDQAPTNVRLEVALLNANAGWMGVVAPAPGDPVTLAFATLIGTGAVTGVLGGNYD